MAGNHRSSCHVYFVDKTDRVCEDEEAADEIPKCIDCSEQRANQILQSQFLCCRIEESVPPQIPQRLRLNDTVLLDMVHIPRHGYLKVAIFTVTAHLWYTIGRNIHQCMSISRNQSSVLPTNLHTICALSRSYSSTSVARLHL